MPSETSWRVWAATGVCLAVGLAGYLAAFWVAITLSAVQTVIYDFKEPASLTFPVQIRFAYTSLLVLCQLPWLQWLYWLPTIGTFALVLFGYCLMARLLSLLPGNRAEPLSLELIRRTFFTPPVLGNGHLPVHGCPWGICSLEGKVATSLPGNLTNQNYEHRN